MLFNVYLERNFPNTVQFPVVASLTGLPPAIRQHSIVTGLTHSNIISSFFTCVLQYFLLVLARIFVFKIYFYSCVCVCLYVYIPHVFGCQKSDSLKQELQVAVSHLAWVLRPELESFGIAAKAFNHWTPSSGPTYGNFNVYFSDA